MKSDGKEVVVEPGGVIAAPAEDVTRTSKKTGKTGATGTGPVTLPTATNLKGSGGGTGAGGGVGGGVTAMAVGASTVIPSVFPSGKKQIMAAAKSGKGVLHVTAPAQPCKCDITVLIILGWKIVVKCLFLSDPPEQVLFCLSTRGVSCKE